MSSTSVKYLCRVCTGKGLISIESNKLPENLFIQNKFIWQTPVKDMIQLISGEPVDSDDDLPQFICTVCLFYLHHSWELRQNIIKNSLNLRAALELSSDSSADYKAKLKVETATQREIRLDEEESLEEQRLYQLQKMNVDDKLDYNHNRLKGVNCAGCGLRYMDGDIFKKHKASCIILKISILSAELKRLTGLRQGSKIDNTEFILRASEAIRLTLPAAQKYKIKKPEKVKSSDAIEKTKLEDENLDDLETTRTFKGTQI